MYNVVGVAGVVPNQAIARSMRCVSIWNDDCYSNPAQYSVQALRPMIEDCGIKYHQHPTPLPLSSAASYVSKTTIHTGSVKGNYSPGVTTKGPPSPSRPAGALDRCGGLSWPYLAG